MKKSTKILLIVLCVVCLLVAAISAYRLISILGEYNKAVESYEDMSQSFVNTEPAATPEPTAAPAGEEAAPAEAAEPEKPAELSPITVDFDNLLSTNEDVVGWIYCKDTVINYPIAQGADNDEYLHLLSHFGICTLYG